MPRPRGLLRAWPQLRSYSSSPAQDVPALQRELFRRVAQPVAVLTAHIPPIASDDYANPTPTLKHNHGATLSSLTSISLSPALVSFSLRLPSRLASHLAKTARNGANSAPAFKLHLLSKEQEDFARLFARQAPLPAPALPSADTDWSIEPKFDSETFEVIEKASLGLMECRVVKTVDLWEIGTEQQDDKQASRKGTAMRSQLFIAQVQKVQLGETGHESGSLVWVEQGYKAVGSNER
ncbi:uncharacterized protein JCM15063_001291 [Sporobolomyces koalae]|uniref:uncharacterized protein n=1 Tax=Sporobolomyces koalae TaxID=500713 RepID=UPI00317976F1